MSEGYEAVEAVYRRFARKERLPGLIAGVVTAEGLQFSLSLGMADVEQRRPVDPSTSFRIASMSKHVTALGVLALRDQGRLSLHQPVAELVPEFRVEAPADCRPVTLLDLLNHVEGFVTDDPWGDRELNMTPADFTRLLAEGELSAQPPGLVCEYSNLGYAILGRVITNVSGQPYQAFLRERLFAPLGLTGTGFDGAALGWDRVAKGYRQAPKGWGAEVYEPDGEFGAMGGLITSGEDFGRWLAFLIDAWPPRDAPDDAPVARASRRELGLRTAPPWPPIKRRHNGRAVPVAGAYGFGLIACIDEVLGRYLQHSGGLPGFGSNMLFSPEAGIGVFAFANKTYAPAVAANWAAAAALKAAGLWTPRQPPVGAELAAGLAAVVQAYGAGRIRAVEAALSGNLLLDAPEAEFDARLASLRDAAGALKDASVTPKHRLAGRFRLECETTVLTGDISLTPGRSPKIQVLRFDDLA